MVFFHLVFCARSQLIGDEIGQQVNVIDSTVGICYLMCGSGTGVDEEVISNSEAVHIDGCLGLWS